MTRDGKPIWRVNISKPVPTGIDIEPLMEGLVPEYESREAAVYCHYRPNEYAELPHYERALCVAQYRISKLMALHSQDAVNSKMDRMARAKGR